MVRSAADRRSCRYSLDPDATRTTAWFALQGLQARLTDPPPLVPPASLRLRCGFTADLVARVVLRSRRQCWRPHGFCRGRRSPTHRNMLSQAGGPGRFRAALRVTTWVQDRPGNDPSLHSGAVLCCGIRGPPEASSSLLVAVSGGQAPR
jgi:hypothetical protein